MESFAKVESYRWRVFPPNFPPFINRQGEYPMEDKKQKLIEIVRGASGNTSRRKPAQSSLAVRIEGSHNIVGDGNIVIHAKTVRPRNTIDPRASELSEAQKLRLRELINEWVTVHNTVRTRAKPLTHAAAWASFQRKFSVTSYHLLPIARYAEAVRWLQQQRAKIDSMKSAAARDPSWRARQIAYIKAHCKNDLGDAFAYMPYIARFGKKSLADLTNEELARTRSYVARKKPFRSSRKDVFCRT
ncbi:DNA-binding protein [Hydrogenophilus thermoluteolus]|uniref:DNA-binding protein n=2 Tax=Hydrogenophilus thermoluteolus TaxID=297 RepID=A0A2Z6DY10_HYDTE|nr:DNA-binding protein [Hydrogenophilus thermoluteolus]